MAVLNNRPKDRLPRLRFNGNGTISVIDWGCADLKTVLVEIPGWRGRYLFTSPSVLMVACEECHAEIGEPCKKHQTADGYGSGTHWKRERAYQAKKKQEFCEHRAWVGDAQ